MLRIRPDKITPSATRDFTPDLYVMLHSGDLGWTMYEAGISFCPDLSPMQSSSCLISPEFPLEEMQVFFICNVEVNHVSYIMDLL